MSNSERPKVGIGVAIRKDGKVLMGLRRGNHATGTWCFPGGHLEYGESFEACALREVAEECGLTITTPVLGCVTNDIFPDGKHYVGLIMVADWVSGEPVALEPDKLTDWHWAAWHSLPEPTFISYINAKQQGFDPMQLNIKVAA